MSVSIIACPACGTMLLSDTSQCPSCRHVLDEDFASHGTDEQRARDRRSLVIEDPCPHCNELVRRGLVRCWNCGTFMREEIAEIYRRMQAVRSPVIYSELSHGSVEQITDDEDVPLSPMEQDEPEPADEEFEFGGGFDDAEDDFELETSELMDEGELSDDFYGLQTTDGPEERRAGSGQSMPAVPNDSNSSASLSAESNGSRRSDTRSAATPAAQQSSNSSEEESIPMEQHHSVATGGDVLWQTALQEESESKDRRAERSRRGKGTRPGTILVFCPNGHRIEVREKYRGKAGRCPRCKSPFFVPDKTWVETASPSDAASSANESTFEPAAAHGEVAEGVYSRWLKDVRLHELDLAKLKLTPGSLATAFKPVDLGFAPDGLLEISLVKKGGLFGSGGKKVDESRQAMLSHLAEKKPLADLPVGEQRLHKPESMASLLIAQPPVHEGESLFHGVPVFGEGRIGVRLPGDEGKLSTRFVSFALSEFRLFSQFLSDVYLFDGLGEESEIPMTDRHAEAKCHYTGQPVRYLEAVPYYQADPELKLTLVGHRCQECGVVMSEAGRANAKFGGKSGSGIAKATCPKCMKKFGSNPLYALEGADDGRQPAATAAAGPDA